MITMQIIQVRKSKLKEFRAYGICIRVKWVLTNQPDERIIESDQGSVIHASF